MTRYRTLALGALLVLASGAHAHHSFAMFDTTVEQTIEGTVKEFQWTNPHVWIQVNVAGADGKVVEYSIEGSSPNGLRREGWKSSTLKPGDHIVLTMHPLRGGAPGGSFVKAIVNGEPLVRAPRQAPPP